MSDEEALRKIINVEHPLLMQAWAVLQLHTPRAVYAECECCGGSTEWYCEECDWEGYSGEEFMKHLRVAAGFEKP